MRGRCGVAFGLLELAALLGLPGLVVVVALPESLALRAARLLDVEVLALFRRGELGEQVGVFGEQPEDRGCFDARLEADRVLDGPE